MGWVLGFICIGMGGHSVSPGFGLPEVGQGFCVVLYTEKNVFRAQTLGWAKRKGRALNETCAHQKLGFPPVSSYSREAYCCASVPHLQGGGGGSYSQVGLLLLGFSMLPLTTSTRPYFLENLFDVTIVCFRCPALQPMHSNSLAKLWLSCEFKPMCLSVVC